MISSPGALWPAAQGAWSEGPDTGGSNVVSTDGTTGNRRRPERNEATVTGVDIRSCSHPDRRCPMTDTFHVLLAVGVLSALSSPVLAGPCSERIAQIERSISMNGADAGPAVTGAVQGDASGATAGNNAGPADTSSRLPANRPATPETTAAQMQAKTADQAAAANMPADPNRLPANRPPSPESYAAAIEAGQSAPSGTGPRRNEATMALLSEARNLDQAGREADCMQSVSRIDQMAASPSK